MYFQIFSMEKIFTVTGKYFPILKLGHFLTHNISKNRHMKYNIQNWRFDPSLASFLLRTDDSHCNRVHSSLTSDHCFDNGYVGKQPLTRNSDKLFTTQCRLLTTLRKKAFENI